MEVVVLQIVVRRNFKRANKLLELPFDLSEHSLILLNFYLEFR